MLNVYAVVSSDHGITGVPVCKSTAQCEGYDGIFYYAMDRFSCKVIVGTMVHGYIVSS